MKRVVATGAAVIGLLAASASGAAAADRGNHEAIWKSPQHGSLASGSDWGAAIGDLASSGGLKPTGVSEGVHDAKDQPVPGQNK